MTTMTLHVEGERAADLARGITAAEAVFEAAKIAPWDAAVARFEREGWDFSQFAQEISDATLDAVAVLDAAEHAALESFCGECVPQGASLEVLPGAT